jgi:hypothetical protein
VTKKVVGVFVRFSCAASSEISIYTYEAENLCEIINNIAKKGKQRTNFAQNDNNTQPILDQF